MDPRARHELEAATRAHRAGDLAGAERIYRAMLAADPGDADAARLLGVVCLQTGRDNEAIDLARRALSLRPEFPEAHNDLGIALEGRNELLEAEASYRAAIRQCPEYAEGHHNLGNVLRKQGRLDDAIEAYGVAIRLRPTSPASYNGLGMTMLEQGDLDEALKHYWRWASLLPKSPAAHSDLLFWLLHHPRYAPEELYRAHRKWDERHATRIRPPAVPGHANDPDPARAIRVGYVSPDFREHTVARFFEPVLAGHDPANVVTICYSDVGKPDAVTRRLRAMAHEWRETAGLPDERLAETIRRDRIDILVDLTGHMAHNRLMVFARRPAPIQATYLGYPHTTGMPTMDYRITDALSDPPGMSELVHVETLIRLPGCAWCYQPTESPPVNALPADDNGYITFGSFNRMAKITPAVASLWAAILRAMPDARLLVLAAGGETNRAARRMFEASGVDARRLALIPQGPRDQYLDVCRRADVALDPFPYNGMTTTCDLLWMGVPVVTLSGASHRSRVGLSLLSAVGLAELASSDTERYVRIAVELARDRNRLRELRKSLRERAGCELVDPRGVAEKLEHAYRALWTRWCAAKSEEAAPDK